MLPELKSIIDLLKAFPTEQDCINHLEALRWNGNVVSPFDATSKVYKCAGNKYKCKNTGKYFNVRTNTVFDNTKIELQKWFLALYVFSSHKKGISSHQLAKDIDVTQKSAWFMLHRLRYAFEHPNFKATLTNVVEVDETFVGGESKNKHANKKAKNERGGTVSTKVPVIGILERGGDVIAKAIANTHKDTLLPEVFNNVEAGSVIMTDSYPAYKGLDKVYTHLSVNHKIGEYVKGLAHTNNIENFWSHMQRGIIGIYHQVSSKHLQPYIDEFTLRYNTRTNTASARFNLVLSNTGNRRLTYKTLIANA